ncbi:hypothetical protein JG687_00000415 [Phytophthora cactorum]|uniref:DDE-1 domain-containing protein n=1 Tax=Phytophthora cactorum TaxID=29920 RepID=A0A329T2R5_9STRA|nr:hypothetical protein Pcac1_g2585 [Phytophthora cactorum]KAG2797917.1 hypothetical protein PC111_g21078 [Phytophthora cactorum]KAG2837765.1 hypothetical protein PC112_g4770 [Phytophthora cactorum]KAG2893938.1 hypothetical protein PC117_g23651 [Phytophthora cactorum]KAG2923153.1 hypothetical protein PC114_g4932 [Phytophthora cactorum]
MLRRQLQDHEGSRSAFEFKPSKRPTLCGWVRTSWNKLSVSTIKNSFRRAHILAPLPAREQQQEEPRLPDVGSVTKQELRLIEDSVADILSDDELNFSDSESENDAVAISLYNRKPREH